MARDDTARNSNRATPLPDRRSHLKLAGATAATVARAGRAASLGTVSDGTISVSAGETQRIPPTGGEALGNALIDVTADVEVQNGS
jgi:hypothetical protein